MKASVNYPAMAVGNAKRHKQNLVCWAVSCSGCSEDEKNKITDCQHQYCDSSYVLNPSYLIVFYMAADT